MHQRAAARPCANRCNAPLSLQVTFTALLDRFPAPTASATRTLVLVGAVELADQARSTIRRLLPDKHVEIEQGVRKASALADVTIATVQSLRNRLDRYQPSAFKVCPHD